MMVVDCLAFEPENRSCRCCWKGSKETAAGSATEAKSPEEAAGRKKRGKHILSFLQAQVPVDLLSDLFSDLFGRACAAQIQLPQ